MCEVHSASVWARQYLARRCSYGAPDAFTRVLKVDQLMTQVSNKYMKREHVSGVMDMHSAIHLSRDATMRYVIVYTRRVLHTLANTAKIFTQDVYTPYLATHIVNLPPPCHHIHCYGWSLICVGSSSSTRLSLNIAALHPYELTIPPRGTHPAVPSPSVTLHTSLYFSNRRVCVCALCRASAHSHNLLTPLSVQIVLTKTKDIPPKLTNRQRYVLPFTASTLKSGKGPL